MNLQAAVSRPPYAPDGYTSSASGRMQVWKRAGSPVEPCEAILDDVLDAVERRLAFRASGRLDVIIYASNADACAALERAVPGNMLLAPLQSAAQSVIALQSVAADPVNGDIARMRRLFAHELTHVIAACRTGSEKRLGDGDRSLRIEPWVNEGFACVVAAIVSERLDLIDRELAREATAHVPDLNASLNDLNGQLRSAAFAIATSRVWRAVEAHGLQQVFATLDAPKMWSAIARERV